MKFLDKASLFFIGLVITASVVFMSLYFFPITVVKTNVAKYKILTPHVHAGGEVTYLIDACKYLDSPGIVSRTFVNDGKWPAMTSNSNMKRGCRKLPVTIIVPNYLPATKYHIDLDVTYQINRLRAVQYHFETEDFIVASASAN